MMNNNNNQQNYRVIKINQSRIEEFIKSRKVLIGFNKVGSHISHIKKIQAVITNKVTYNGTRFYVGQYISPNVFFEVKKS